MYKKILTLSGMAYNKHSIHFISSLLLSSLLLNDVCRNEKPCKDKSQLKCFEHELCLFLWCHSDIYIYSNTK